MYRLASSMSLCVLAVTTACQGSTVTEFPDGLAPLEELQVAVPEGDGRDAFPEAVNIASGETEEYYWGHAAGFVPAPVADVWAALQEPDVNVDRLRVDEWTANWDVPTDFDVAYQIDHTVYDVLTVEWTVEWRHGAVSGSAEEPEAVGGRWQKVEGTTFITTLQGSFALYEVDEAITQVEFIEHLSALQSSEEDIVNFFTDMYAEVVSIAHGDGLPAAEDLPTAQAE